MNGGTLLLQNVDCVRFPLPNAESPAHRVKEEALVHEVLPPFRRRGALDARELPLQTGLARAEARKHTLAHLRGHMV